MAASEVWPVVCASRRTDLPGGYPEWLARALDAGEAHVRQPYSGRVRRVDLSPAQVHTLVLLSKDFGPLLRDEAGLRSAVSRYEQVCCQLTVTGLGGSWLEPHVPPAEATLAQVAPLARWLGPERVTVRFDPIVHWVEQGRLQSNREWAERVFGVCAEAGIGAVRLSFAQIYAKMRRRGVEWHDLSRAERMVIAGELVRTATDLGLELLGCCQPDLAKAGIRPSPCIDGATLARLHPRRLPAVTGKDPGQRGDCLCSASVDIGSYDMTCPHGCRYCYANPRLTGG